LAGKWQTKPKNGPHEVSEHVMLTIPRAMYFKCARVPTEF